MLKFDVLEKGLGIVYPPHFENDIGQCECCNCLLNQALTSSSRFYT